MSRSAEPDTVASREIRERTLSALARIQMIGQRHNVEGISRRIADLSAIIEENRYQVAVVGQFKRGKTSVLNALLGSEVLPVGAVPFTSVITVVKYGALPGVQVVFNTGEQRPIPLTELSDYVSETGNPGNSKGVDHVDVFYPSNYLQDGVVLTNSPGFGGPNEHATRLAYDFLPQIDAAIFVTSPDPPLTSAEIAFLTKLGTTVSHVFVVMNKADLADPRSLAAILEFASKAITTAVGRRTPIYIISARHCLSNPALERCTHCTGSGFHQLEYDLQRLLDVERRKALHASVLGGVVNAASELRMHLKLRVQAAKVSALDLQSKITAFETDLGTALQEQQKNETSLITKITNLCTLVDSEAPRFGESKSALVVSAIWGYRSQCAGTQRADFVSSLNRFCGWQIQRTFDEWRTDFESSLGKAAREAFLQHVELANLVISRIAKAAFELFGVKINADRIEEQPPFIASHYQTEISAGLRLGGFSVLLPNPLFRWCLLRKTITMAALDVHRNAELIAKDLTLRLERQTTEFCDRVRRRVAEIVDVARTALHQPCLRQQSSHGCELILELSRDIDELDQIASDLNPKLGVQYAVEA
jgi:Dynamin family